ncbi:transposase [Streptomyces flavidovirens]|uniref:Transposase n=1 Tax=Streptomyces flavidovirens TaxID=67298 RepID=A0ABW6RIG3_9ACTN
MRVSLLPEVVPGEAFAEASYFRDELYVCLTVRGDEFFELADAVLCAPGAVRSTVDLTLLPEHRRGHGAMYDGLNHGRIDADRLRRCWPVCRCPASRTGGWSWRWTPRRGCGRTHRARRTGCSATSTAGRRRPRSSSPDGPTRSSRRWRWAPRPGGRSWTQILDAVRLGPADDATAVTATQLRNVVQRLIAAGQW